MTDSRRGFFAPGTGKPRTCEPTVRGVTKFGRRAATCRAGWAEACKKLVAKGGDALVLPELGNKIDSILKW